MDLITAVVAGLTGITCGIFLALVIIWLIQDIQLKQKQIKMADYSLKMLNDANKELLELLKELK